MLPNRSARLAATLLLILLLGWAIRARRHGSPQPLPAPPPGGAATLEPASQKNVPAG